MAPLADSFSRPECHATQSMNVKSADLHCGFLILFYTCCMETNAMRISDTLAEAIEKVKALPEPAQDRIAEELVLHVGKLQRLRTQLEAAALALDHGDGRELDINEVIGRARRQYGVA